MLVVNQMETNCEDLPHLRQSIEEFRFVQETVGMAPITIIVILMQERDLKKNLLQPRMCSILLLRKDYRRKEEHSQGQYQSNHGCTSVTGI